MFKTLAKEPPLRILSAALIKRTSRSLQAQALWDTWPRPNYLQGVLSGARQAQSEGVGEISVIEFGVSAGSGLIALQKVAAAVERETGVVIHVFGFDLGIGLPESCGDYRDHPDRWQPGDFPMTDPQCLLSNLDDRTRLILGDVAQTVPEFITSSQPAPVGFVAIDLDLYSSSCHALEIFSHPQKDMLCHVPMYLDDSIFFSSNKFAGELLALEEFNVANRWVKIDRWRELPFGRPFFERKWLRAMYLVHDFDRLNRSSQNMAKKEVPLNLDGAET